MRNKAIVLLIVSISATGSLLAACWSLRPKECPENNGEITCFGKKEYLDLLDGNHYQIPSSAPSTTMRTSWKSEEDTANQVAYQCTYITAGGCRRMAYPNAVLIGSSCRAY